MLVGRHQRRGAGSRPRNPQADGIEDGSGRLAGDADYRPVPLPKLGSYARDAVWGAVTARTMGRVRACTGFKDVFPDAEGRLRQRLRRLVGRVQYGRWRQHGVRRMRERGMGSAGEGTG